MDCSPCKRLLRLIWSKKSCITACIAANGSHMTLMIFAFKTHSSFMASSFTVWVNWLLFGFFIKFHDCCPYGCEIYRLLIFALGNQHFYWWFICSGVQYIYSLLKSFKFKSLNYSFKMQILPLFIFFNHLRIQFFKHCGVHKVICWVSWSWDTYRQI